MNALWAYVLNNVIFFETVMSIIKDFGISFKLCFYLDRYFIIILLV